MDEHASWDSMTDFSINPVITEYNKSAGVAKPFFATENAEFFEQML